MSRKNLRNKKEFKKESKMQRNNGEGERNFRGKITETGQEEKKVCFCGKMKINFFCFFLFWVSKKKEIRKKGEKLSKNKALRHRRK